MWHARRNVYHELPDGNYAYNNVLDNILPILFATKMNMTKVWMHVNISVNWNWKRRETKYGLGCSKKKHNIKSFTVQALSFVSAFLSSKKRTMEKAGFSWMKTSIAWNIGFIAFFLNQPIIPNIYYCSTSTHKQNHTSLVALYTVSYSSIYKQVQNGNPKSRVNKKKFTTAYITRQNDNNVWWRQRTRSMIMSSFFIHQKKAWNIRNWSKWKGKIL